MPGSSQSLGCRTFYREIVNAGRLDTSPRRRPNEDVPMDAALHTFTKCGGEQIK
jgi:hypothetical protein